MFQKPTFRTHRPQLSIIIPARNNRDTIIDVIERVRAVEFGAQREIIVVDDASRDGTTQLLEELTPTSDWKLIRHSFQRGTGAAIESALREATGRFVVIQDAEGCFDPASLQSMFFIVARGQASVCFGSRFVPGASSPMGLGRGVDWIVTALSRRFGHGRLTDATTSYQMMPIEMARQLNYRVGDYAVSAAITAQLQNMNVRLVDRPVRHSPIGGLAGIGKSLLNLFGGIATAIRHRVLHSSGPHIGLLGHRLQEIEPIEYQPTLQTPASAKKRIAGMSQIGDRIALNIGRGIGGSIRSVRRLSVAKTSTETADAVCGSVSHSTGASD